MVTTNAMMGMVAKMAKIALLLPFPGLWGSGVNVGKSRAVEDRFLLQKL